MSWNMGEFQFVDVEPDGTHTELWRGDECVGYVASDGERWHSVPEHGRRASFNNRGMALAHVVETIARFGYS